MTLKRPIWMQAGGADPTFEYSAMDLRAPYSALTAQEGVFWGLEVTQRGAGANFSVDVSSGQAVVAGDDVSWQGHYVLSADATENVTIPAAPASGSRTHRVIARVRDKLHNGALSTYEWTIEVQEDTGSGTPALEASAIPLAEVTVTSATVSITSSNITDKRIRAHLHPALDESVASAAARPANPVSRQRIWRTDLSDFEIYNGTAWKQLGLNPPFATLTRTADQTIATGTTTAVAWDAELEDTHNGHSTVTNNSRYTAPIAGVYAMDVTIPWAANSTGIRQIGFRVNGSGGTTYTGPRLPSIASFTSSYPGSRKIRLAAGDYVEVMVTQNSGGSLAIDFDYELGPMWDITWLRP